MQGGGEGGISGDSALKDSEQSQDHSMPLCPRDGSKVKGQAFHLQVERESGGLLQALTVPKWLKDLPATRSPERSACWILWSGSHEHVLPQMQGAQLYPVPRPCPVAAPSR